MMGALVGIGDVCILSPQRCDSPKWSRSPGGRRFGTFLGGSKYMVKKLLLLAVLALALPLAAFANSSIDVGNAGGVLSGNSSGLSLTGSTLIKYGSAVGTNLGSVSFTTGALISGSLMSNGTFAAGGSFEIVGNGSS